MNQYKLQESKRQKQADSNKIINEKRIQDAKNEIHNLQVILKAVPENQTGAREILNYKIEELQKLMPKFTAKIWWHWLLEYCPQCDQYQSQSPMPENLGEDCELFSKIEEYKHKQNEGETDYKCSSGHKLVLLYRHASADMTEEAKKEAYDYCDQRTESEAV